MAGQTLSTAQRDTGFSLPFGASEARRQLHLSIGLVTMLAVGIVSAAMAVGSHPLPVRQDVVASHAPASTMRTVAKITGANPI